MSAGLPIASAAIDVSDLVAQNEPGVVVIIGTRTKDGGTVQSSGCVVSAAGHILTTAHQIAGVDKMLGRFSDGTETPLTLLQVDANREIALLQAQGPFDQVPMVGDAFALRKGEAIFSIAAPRNIEFTVVTGIVANNRATLRDYPVLLAKMEAAPGSSGGPVFDQTGMLVGLIIGKLRDEEWLTAVNPVNNAYALLRGVGVSPMTASRISEGDALLPAADITTGEFRAIEAYNRGVYARDPELKIASYRETVAGLPEFFRGWFNLAVALGNAQDYAGAEAAYRKAANLRPDAVDVYRNLARIFFVQARNEDALDALRQARDLAPEEPQSYNDLGEAYRRLEQYDKAMSAFREAIGHDENYAPAWYNLGLAAVAQDDKRTAAEAFDRYLALRPDAADAAQVRAWIVELRGVK